MAPITKTRDKTLKATLRDEENQQSNTKHGSRLSEDEQTVPATTNNLASGTVNDRKRKYRAASRGERSSASANKKPRKGPEAPSSPPAATQEADSEDPSSSDSALPDDWFKARCILKQKGDKFLIDWEDDPKTKKPYEPTWEPRRNLNPELLKDWKQRQKADAERKKKEAQEKKAEAQRKKAERQQKKFSPVGVFKGAVNRALGRGKTAKAEATTSSPATTETPPRKLPPLIFRRGRRVISSSPQPSEAGLLERSVAADTAQSERLISPAPERANSPEGENSSPAELSSSNVPHFTSTQLEPLQASPLTHHQDPQVEISQKIHFDRDDYEAFASSQFQQTQTHLYEGTASESPSSPRVPATNIISGPARFAEGGIIPDSQELAGSSSYNPSTEPTNTLSLVPNTQSDISTSEQATESQESAQDIPVLTPTESVVAVPTSDPIEDPSTPVVDPYHSDNLPESSTQTVSSVSSPPPPDTPQKSQSQKQTTQDQTSQEHITLAKIQTAENQTVEDRTVEHETVDDQTVEQETIEHETVEHETFEKKTAENQTLDKQTLEQEVVHQEVVEQEIVEETVEQEAAQAQIQPQPTANLTATDQAALNQLEGQISPIHQSAHQSEARGIEFQTPERQTIRTKSPATPVTASQLPLSTISKDQSPTGLPSRAPISPNWDPEVLPDYEDEDPFLSEFQTADYPIERHDFANTVINTIENTADKPASSINPAHLSQSTVPRSANIGFWPGAQQTPARPPSQSSTESEAVKSISVERSALETAAPRGCKRPLASDFFNVESPKLRGLKLNTAVTASEGSASLAAISSLPKVPSQSPNTLATNPPPILLTPTFRSSVIMSNSQPPSSSADGKFSMPELGSLSDQRRKSYDARKAEQAARRAEDEKRFAEMLRQGPSYFSPNKPETRSPSTIPEKAPTDPLPPTSLRESHLAAEAPEPPMDIPAAHPQGPSIEEPSSSTRLTTGPNLNWIGEPRTSQGEILLALPMVALQQDAYKKEMVGNKKVLYDFLDTPTNPDLIEKATKLLDRLDRIGQHWVLSYGSELPQDADEAFAKDEDSSGKLRFLAPFLENLRAHDMHVVILAKPKEYITLVEMFLRGSKLTYARPDIESKVVHEESNLTITLLPTSGEGSGTVARAADLVIAFDSTADIRSEAVQTLRSGTLPDAEVAPVISLVTVNTPEHANRCLSENITPSTDRLLYLVTAVCTLWKEAGNMRLAKAKAKAKAQSKGKDKADEDDNEDYPRSAADKVYDLLRSGTNDLSSRWDLPSLQALSQSQFEEEAPMMSRSVSASSQQSQSGPSTSASTKKMHKRRASATDTQPIKKPRLSPPMDAANECPPASAEQDITHISDSLKGPSQTQAAPKQIPKAPKMPRAQLLAELNHSHASSEKAKARAAEFEAQLTYSQREFEMQSAILRQAKRDRDEASSDRERAELKQKKAEEFAEKMRAERDELAARLAMLLSSESEIQGHAAQLSAKLAEANRKREVVEKGLKALEAQQEYVKEQYMRASDSAATYGRENDKLKNENTYWHRLADDRERLLSELQRQKMDGIKKDQLLSQNLRQQLDNMQRLYAQKCEELKNLQQTQTRPGVGTRASSAPRSPRVGGNGNNGFGGGNAYGGPGSRHASPMIDRVSGLRRG